MRTHGRTTHEHIGVDAPGWLAFGVPAIVWPVVFASAFLYQPLYQTLQRKEAGLEWLTFGTLLIGAGVGLYAVFTHRSVFPRRWLSGWFILGAIGMIVFAGEEVSWGQHFGLWTGDQLPERWRQINDQQETNFHNITNALDQGPTNVVMLATLFAFAGLPILQRVKREVMGPENPGYWFWPTYASLGAGVGVLLVPVPAWVYGWVTGEPEPNTLRHSECHEFYIALLMTTYMVSMFCRARALHRHSAGATAESSAPPTTD
jgi:hypothetical protein